MPRNFAIGQVDVWLPAQFAPGMLQARNARFVNGIGRLKPGVSVEQAADDLDRVQRELAAVFPKTDAGSSAAVADLKGFRVGDQGVRLWMAFGAVALLWLIAISNICGLVLVEARRRSRELAMRRALGASRLRITSLVVQEALLLAFAGLILGIAVAAWALQYVRSTLLMIPRITELTLDWRVCLFAAVTSTVAALVCGVIPALSSTRGVVVQQVTRGDRGAIAGPHRLQYSLVVAQIALGVLLCTSALLLAKSYVNLAAADLGFSAERVVTFHIAARWDEDRSRVGEFQESVVAALERLRDVEAVGVTSLLAIGGAPWRHEVTVEGLTPTESGTPLTACQRTIGAGYLQAIRVPLVAGEWCPGFRRSGQPRVTLVNKAFADRFGRNTNVIGQRLRFPQFDALHTIGGVVGNVAEDGAAVSATPYVYVCGQPGDWPDPEYVARVADPGAFIAALRSTIREIDATRAIFSIRPLPEVVRSAVEQPRIGMGLIAGFAGAALLLAGTGLHGLFMLVVAEARREMGVRLALGAAPNQLVQSLCARAGSLLGLGIFIGLALTAPAGRWLQSPLFGIRVFDGLVLAATIVTVTLVSAIAIAVPAFRASRVMPSEALRVD